MPYQFQIIPTPGPVVELVDVPDDLATDLADIAKLPKDRQADITLPSEEEVTKFIAMAKSYAAQNGLTFARRNPTATTKISDAPLRVSFRLYKPRAKTVQTPADDNDTTSES
ncbi:MAG TPA: hypothetical protein VIY48_11025 [Candidatus Paceibacterota bacterium]